MGNKNFSKKLKRIKALIKKEFFQIIRDPSTILIAIIFPMVLLFIYGVGVSLDMNNLKVGLVLEDTNPEATSFYASLKDSKYFSIDISNSRKDLEKKINASKLKGMVIVPFYFSDYKKRLDKKGPIYVVADGSEPNTANFVQNYVMGAYNKWLIQQKLTYSEPDIPKIQIQQRFWYNEQLESRYFLIPGAIAIIMTLIGTLLTALVISREWERGTMESMLATPITMREFFIAKMFSYFTLGMLSMIFCTFLSIVFYDVPFRGSFLALLVVSSVFLLASLGFGLLISSVAKSQFIASQIAILTSFMPAFNLSGFVFEISSMPYLIRLASHIIPAKYMVSSLSTLFLAGNVWRLLIINILALLVFAFVFFTIMAFRTKKRLD
ncbi:MAG: ABC transporter permease [Parachlamydiales bacterium]